MDRNILSIIRFLVLVALYGSALAVLGPLLPEICLIVLVVWLLLRRPWHHPERIESDLDVVSRKLANGVETFLDAVCRILKGP